MVSVTLPTAGAVRENRSGSIIKTTGITAKGDGAIYKNGFQEVDGNLYYFQSWGGCVTGTKKIDGTTYVFDKNGVLLSEKES